MEYGWVGKILRVNLSTGETGSEETEPYKKYIGGCGMAARIFFDEVSKDVMPFDEKNKMIFMTGPLTGTLLPCTSRVEIASKSPMSFPHPMWVRSSVGGSFGPALKFAGFDGIVLDGKSSKPVVLVIEDGTVNIRDASHLWGLDTFETQIRISKILGNDVKVLCIGPAGENLVRDAIILHNAGNTSGLAGFGAVMGSKKIKAIAVRGGRCGIRVAHPDTLLKLNQHITRLIYDPDNPPGLTGCDYDFRANHAAHIDSAARFVEKYRNGNRACFGCPVSCYPRIKVPQLGPGSQICYWTILGEFGTSTWQESWELGLMIDKLGISMQGAVAIRNWLLNLKRLNMLGDRVAERMIGNGGIAFYRELIPMIAYRQGMGDVLAEGLPRAAQCLERGHGLFVHYNGWVEDFQDLRENTYDILCLATGTRIEHDDQYGTPMFRGIAPETNMPTAERRERNYTTLFGPIKAHDPARIEGKAFPSVHTQNYKKLMDAMTLCKRIYPMLLSGYGTDNKGDMSLHSRMYNAVTGGDLSEEGLFKKGAMLFNLERMLGVKYGYHSRENDLKALDDRLFTEPYEHSPLPQKKIDRHTFLSELDHYYQLRGWDLDTGVPTKKTMEVLDLNDMD